MVKKKNTKKSIKWTALCTWHFNESFKNFWSHNGPWTKVSQNISYWYICLNLLIFQRTMLLSFTRFFLCILCLFLNRFLFCSLRKCFIWLLKQNILYIKVIALSFILISYFIINQYDFLQLNYKKKASKLQNTH